MKKQLSIAFLAAAFGAMFLTSCSKKEEPPAPKTKTQLISQSSWKFKSVTVGGTDASSATQACQRDNILTFGAAGGGTADEGATKCAPADLQINLFTWTFANSETTLNVSNSLITFGGTGNTSFTIVSLTETELVLSFLYTPPVGAFQTVVLTFQH